MFINNLEVKIFEKNRRKLKKIEKEIYAVREGSKYRSSPSASNLCALSPILDTIFNTNPTKNRLNLVTSIDILSDSIEIRSSII